MILNNDTAEKVASLLNIPINTVEYNGAYNDTVMFFVGTKNKEGIWINGVAVSVSEQFKIKKVERIKVSVGRFTRNYPVRKFTVPIYATN